MKVGLSQVEVEKQRNWILGDFGLKVSSSLYSIERAERPHVGKGSSSVHQ